jgi:hypothetical protein
MPQANMKLAYAQLIVDYGKFINSKFWTPQTRPTQLNLMLTRSTQVGS